MSLSITFYTFTDDPKVANKTLTTVGSTTGEFRATLDVLRPTFTVKPDQVGSANYCYIEGLNRYYYITGHRKLTSGLTELSLYCDVRQSFYTELIANNGIVERQENNYDMYLKDEKIPIGAKKAVSVYTFPNTPFQGKQGNDDYNRVIMQVLGG